MKTLADLRKWLEENDQLLENESKITLHVEKVQCNQDDAVIDFDIYFQPITGKVTGIAFQYE